MSQREIDLASCAVSLFIFAASLTVSAHAVASHRSAGEIVRAWLSRSWPRWIVEVVLSAAFFALVEPHARLAVAALTCLGCALFWLAATGAGTRGPTSDRTKLAVWMVFSITGLAGLLGVGACAGLLVSSF